MSLVLIVAALLSQEPQDLQRELAPILQRLDSDNLADREAAEAELAAFRKRHGKAAVEALRSIVDTLPPEPAARVRAQLDGFDKVEAAWKLVSIFDLFEMPSVAARKLVFYNTGWTYIAGQEQGFTCRRGWIVSESREEIRLLEDGLSTNVYGREGKLPEGVDPAQPLPKDAPPPGEYRELDFAKLCREMLERGVKEDFGDLDHFESGGLPHGVEPALYAYWAFQRDLEELVLPLLDLARKSAARSEPDQKKTLEERLNSAVADRLRYGAVTGANGGRSHADLLKMWKALAALPKNEWTDEAGEMARAIAGYVAEDAPWKEPSKDEVHRMSRSEKAAYWMRKLRDHAARQWSDPGECYVLGSPGLPEDQTNPADELKKLGWEAIPLLIEHLDDSRPTRCLGWHRSFAPSSYYLLRYGDCCQQIFDAFTGASIYERRSTNGYMMKDGKTSEAKARAQQWWWKENEKLGAEGYYLRMLEGGPEQRGFAAERLLEQDKEKHLPKLIELAARKDLAGRGEILEALAPHLDRQHQAFLEGFLGDDAPANVILAAKLLWEKCGVDAGARALIEQLEKSHSGDSGESAGESIFEGSDRRDAFIAELKAWWAANKGKIDWEKLQKK